MTRRRSWQGGFTLIELMMVVAIIGLLAAVAIPAFQRYIRKSRTVEGIYGVSKIIESARTFMDTRSTVPCDSESDCGSSGLYIGTSIAPNMTFAQANQDHGGAFPESTLKDFSQPGQFFDELHFAPEVNYRFGYYLRSVMWRLGSVEYGGFSVSARSDPGGLDKFIYVYAALIPSNASYVYFTPFFAYGFGPPGSDYGVRGPVVNDNCQEWTCP